MEKVRFYLREMVILREKIGILAKEKPSIYQDKPLYVQKITMWAAWSSIRITGRFFFEGAEGNVFYNIS